jgi:hypothetical protein
VALEKDDTSTSIIHLAVSPTGDPSNFPSWHKFSFDATETINGHNTWADYPGFGVDSSALYITRLPGRPDDRRAQPTDACRNRSDTSLPLARRTGSGRRVRALG